jgi:hypothetical protein
MRLADHSYPILLIERIAIDCRGIRQLPCFFEMEARLEQALDGSLARCANEPIGWG